MKIVLLGANGRTGRKVMQLALDAGYSVTALVRSEQSLDDIQHEKLHIRIGNVLDPDFLKSVFPGHDVVISTLGPRLPTKKACGVYSSSATAIAEAMQEAELKRIIMTSTALLFPATTTISDRILRLIARNNAKSAEVMEKTICETSLDWTFVRVGFLTDTDNKGYKKALGKMPEDSNAISRSAVAHFIFSILEQPQHIGEVIGLSGNKN